MRRFVLLAPFLLAGCLSEQQQCINSVSAELRSVEQRIEVAQGNIARGYAIARVRDARTETYICTETLEDGTEVRDICRRTVRFTRDEPVAIDVGEERIKVRDLQARRAQLLPQVSAQIESCRVAYPEEG